MERTLAIIKPNAVINKKVGKILSMIENDDFNIVSINKHDKLSVYSAEFFYSEHKEQEWFDNLIKFMLSAPIYVLVLEKDNAIEEWRSLMVKIREKYSDDQTRNAVHGSDSPSSAEKEIQFFAYENYKNS